MGWVLKAKKNSKNFILKYILFLVIIFITTTPSLAVSPHEIQGGIRKIKHVLKRPRCRYRQAVERREERNTYCPGLWLYKRHSKECDWCVCFGCVTTIGDNDTTGLDGNYSLWVSDDNYTVNASKRPEYFDYGVSGVVVTPLNTTILNMTIQEKPTGTITGAVRNTWWRTYNIVNILIIKLLLSKHYYIRTFKE